MLRKEVAMGRAISVLCCLIVGLQFLIGVPIVVCILFVAAYGGLGPVLVGGHPGESFAQPRLPHGATIPPPVAALAPVPPRNIIPATTVPDPNNPIVATRA